MLYLYLGCITFGLVYCIFAAVLGAHGFDHGGVDHGGDIGHDGADMPSPFNPLVISSAITTFGVSGFIGKAAFNLTDIWSLVYSFGISVMIGAVIFFTVVKFMYSSQSNSSFSQADLVDTEAEVLTPVPRNGIGEIIYTVNGVRCSLPARSLYKEDLSRGDVVRIKDITGNVAIVAKKLTIDQIDECTQEDRHKSKDNINNLG